MPARSDGHLHMYMSVCGLGMVTLQSNTMQPRSLKHQHNTLSPPSNDLFIVWKARHCDELRSNTIERLYVCMRKFVCACVCVVGRRMWSLVECRLVVLCCAAVIFGSFCYRLRNNGQIDSLFGGWGCCCWEGIIQTPCKRGTSRIQFGVGPNWDAILRRHSLHY